MQISAPMSAQSSGRIDHTNSGMIMATNTHDMPTVAVRNRKNNHNETRMLIIHHGSKQISMPTEVATPLPPRKAKKGEQQLPSSNAHTIPIMHIAVIPHI